MESWRQSGEDLGRGVMTTNTILATYLAHSAVGMPRRARRRLLDTLVGASSWPAVL